MTVIIPIEVKVRELQNRIYLAKNILSKTSHDVILGSQKDIQWKLSFYNCIYLDKGSGTLLVNFLNSIKKNKNVIYQIEEEGPIYSMSNYQKKLRYPQKIFSLIDFFFLWGKKDYDFISKKTNKKNFTVSGHPKFDLLKKQNIKIFEHDVRKIKKKYGNFIFFSSSFSEDYVMDKKIYDKYAKSYLPNNKKDFLKMLREKEDFNKNYFFSIKMLKKLAEKKKNLKIVFRPHPGQDLGKVKKRFKDFQNIIVTKNHCITPWIIASDLYIHSGCTTAFEAQKLKKKIILMYIYKNNHVTMKIGEKVKNFPKLLKIVNNFKKTEPKKFNFSLNSDIENFKNQTYFVNHFLKKIKQEHLLKGSILKKNINQNFFKKFLFKVFSKLKEFKIMLFILQFFLHPKYLLTKKFKETKLNFIKKEEIHYYLNQIYKKQNYKIKSLDKNIFLLRKS